MHRYAGLDNSFVEECLKAHLNVDLDKISVSSGKSDLDEEYYKHQPDPIPQNVLISNCVRIDGSSAANIPKESPRKDSQSNCNKQERVPYRGTLLEPPRSSSRNTSFNRTRRENVFDPQNLENSNLAVRTGVANQTQRKFKEKEVNVARVLNIQSSTATNNDWIPHSGTVVLRKNVSPSQRGIESIENRNDSKDNPRNTTDNSAYKSNADSSTGSNRFRGKGSTYSEPTTGSISNQGTSSASCTAKPNRSFTDNYIKPNQRLVESNVPRGRVMLSNVQTTSTEIPYRQIPHRNSDDVGVTNSIYDEGKVPCCSCVVL